MLGKLKSMKENMTEVEKAARSTILSVAFMRSNI